MCIKWVDDEPLTGFARLWELAEAKRRSDEDYERWKHEYRMRGEMAARRYREWLDRLD